MNQKATNIKVYGKIICPMVKENKSLKEYLSTKENLIEAKSKEKEYTKSMEFLNTMEHLRMTYFKAKGKWLNLTENSTTETGNKVNLTVLAVTNGRITPYIMVTTFKG